MCLTKTTDDISDTSILFIGRAEASRGARAQGERPPAARVRGLVPGARRQVRQERDRHPTHAALPVPAMHLYTLGCHILCTVRPHGARAQNP